MAVNSVMTVMIRRGTFQMRMTIDPMCVASSRSLWSHQIHRSPEMDLLLLERRADERRIDNNKIKRTSKENKGTKKKNQSLRKGGCGVRG